MSDIRDVIAYPVTPFTADGIDTTRLAGLVKRLVADGVHAMAPLGSTGELAYLDDAEFDTVVDTTIAAVDGAVPVLVGVSAMTTAETVRRARYAQQAGADAVQVVPVSYWKLNDREITAHRDRPGGPHPVGRRAGPGDVGDHRRPLRPRPRVGEHLEQLLGGDGQLDAVGEAVRRRVDEPDVDALAGMLLVLQAHL